MWHVGGGEDVFELFKIHNKLLTEEDDLIHYQDTLEHL
jgi:hypothetical protein